MDITIKLNFIMHLQKEFDGKLHNILSNAQLSTQCRLSGVVVMFLNY